MEDRGGGWRSYNALSSSLILLRRLSTDVHVISISPSAGRQAAPFFADDGMDERARSLAAIWVIFCPDFASDPGLLACLLALLPGPLDSVFFIAELNSSF